ncbi:MAG: toxin-antitoxin system HicB family antitoxin [Acidobacteriota bacterium]|nr:type II toxin-antitoxin system HicB family antitoxin [Acidobacteriota bacterium]MCG2817327.1 type II toxin-antitoxin system HicB family antitoxin [Candidatus Aminicenantes bacterium]
MTLIDDRYSYRITWSPEDEEYVGICVEFPSLSWLMGEPESALKGIRNLVSKVVEEMKSKGENPPTPLATKRYSGKFLVRMAPDIHRHLAIQAAEERISLNRLVCSKLSVSD